MKAFNLVIFIVVLLLQSSCQFTQTNQYHLIPEPLNLKTASKQFVFDQQTRLFFDPNLSKEASESFFILIERLKTAAGIELKTADDKKFSQIVCLLNPHLPADESYRLQIEEKKITVEAKKPVGFFYAAQTLRQLLPAAIENKTKQNQVRWAVPYCEIEDTPCYSYRGMHLDVSRHFAPKEEVMHYIDQLALLKINTLHWHLTDDQGWRIEIKKYPKLTETGGYRQRTVIGRADEYPHRWDSTRVGGYYTQQEIKEVINYAQKRFVNILPEIEMPGHAVAALAAYPQYSCTGGPFAVEGLWGVFKEAYCTREETFGFLEDILEEVADLFPYPYIHIGGDECPKERWEKCPICQARIKAEKLKDENELQSYFIRRIARFLESKEKKLIGWDEISEGGELPVHATVMAWRGTSFGMEAARKGHDVIMTPYTALYLDYYQSKQPSEPLAIGGYLPIQTVYNFDPIPSELTPLEAQHILGVQANVWTEYMPNRQQREYMIFPRIAALAEIAWLPPEKKNYERFQQRLPALFERYDLMGINYSRAYYNVADNRFAEDGKLKLNLQTADPQAKIHYTTDGTNATVHSPLYTHPIELGKSPLSVSALPEKNGKPLCGAYSQSFIANKAAGQKVTLSCEPDEKYQGNGGLTLTDCVEGQQHPILSCEWLGYEGRDVEVTIEFDPPVDITKVTVGSTHQPAQWIYAPWSVECMVSQEEDTYRSIGKVWQDEIRRTKSKAVFETRETGVKKLKTAVKNFGIIPKGEPGGGYKAWLFLDEISVE
ncbi:MAG: family 20 glycosylhydrolase [Candidatus Azobacteroides sp.]|nr:family 20 glycosylhydrolase [Candidatus Azobacteroides sp.]